MLPQEVVNRSGPEGQIDSRLQETIMRYGRLDVPVQGSFYDNAVRQQGLEEGQGEGLDAATRRPRFTPVPCA